MQAILKKTLKKKQRRSDSRGDRSQRRPNTSFSYEQFYALHDDPPASRQASQAAALDDDEFDLNDRFG